MKYTLLLFVLVTFILTTVVHSQEITKENDFVVYHYPSSLELEFDTTVAPSDIKVINVFNHKQQPITPATATSFFINEVHPSDIFKVEYTLKTQKSLTPSSTYIASKSASTGAISVYFNHPVDIMYAQTQQAVNLSNTLKDKLITYINNCVATLDIAIYASYSPSATTGIAGAINAAYARGVQVRVIYDGSTS
ncbi:MAG: hypothetical protein WCJ62_11440, partial [Flavobacterium sp.]